MNDVPGVPSRWKRPIRFSQPPAHSATSPGPEAVQPAGDVKVHGRGWSLNVPAVIVTGAISLFGGKVWDAGKVAEIRSDIKELRQDTRSWRDEDRARIRDLTTQLDTEHQFTKRDIPIMARAIELQNPGAKFAWEAGWQPDVDLLPRPLSGASAAIQPARALLRPPVFDE